MRHPCEIPRAVRTGLLAYLFLAFVPSVGVAQESRVGAEFRLQITHLKLTIRAGGAPALIISYAVGCGEGRRTVISFNAAILGDATRPPLD